ncbi:hypothetical protein BO71DRAFT_426055, partial [Aspergillus ellipticus CBS 707.79]
MTEHREEDSTTRTLNSRESAPPGEKASCPDVPDVPSLTTLNASEVAVVVPRSQRRGLFAQVTLVAEIENSRTFSRPKKWMLTAMVSFASLIAPMGSSIFF